jgi:hypothetical protein
MEGMEGYVSQKYNTVLWHAAAIDIAVSCGEGHLQPPGSCECKMGEGLLFIVYW